MNRRPDDECQRACGVYRSVDEGKQVEVIKIQVTGIWLLRLMTETVIVTL